MRIPYCKATGCRCLETHLLNPLLVLLPLEPAQLLLLELPRSLSLAPILLPLEVTHSLSLALTFPGLPLAPLLLPLELPHSLLFVSYLQQQLLI